MTRAPNAPSTFEVLGGVSFLAELPDELLKKLAARVVERTVARGATLFREGEPCAGFWIVATGSANIVKIAPDGRVHILETCGPGTMFALVSALDGGGYPATAEAREASSFVVFPSQLVRDTVVEHPAIGIGIARHFAGRLRLTVCRSASVCLRSVRSRLASFLLESAPSRAGSESLVLSLGTKQEELAHRLGTVREVLARALRNFREENLIAQRGDTITLLDVAGLEKVAGS